MLNTVIIGSPTDERGVVIGEDRVSRAMVTHDQFTAYATGTITSPNVCILGMIGSGKSSLIKTMCVERPLMLRRRPAVVIDKKLRGGEGEYAELTRLFGVRAVPIRPRRPQRHVHDRARPNDPARRREAPHRRVLSAFAQLAGDGPLTEWHEKVLDEAYRLNKTTFEDRRVPVTPDLVEQFPDVVNADEFRCARTSTLDLIDQAAWSMRFRSNGYSPTTWLAC